MPYDSVQGAINGRKSQSERKGRAAALKADPLQLIRAKMPVLLRQLLKAANGEEPYADLPVQQRLTALMKAIEYGIGRPEGISKQQPKDPREDGGGTEAAEGVSFE